MLLSQNNQISGVICMAEKNYSFEIKGIFENLEKLVEEAELGKNEAIQRLNAIKKLANPIFDFSASDYQRILDKKLPLPVSKGIQLYKMMNQLTFLVQPTGKKRGTASAVRRVDYENITWEEFLDLRGTFSAGFVMEAMRIRAAPNFKGIDILNEQQRELYQKIKVYFGHKKKPTLQSLAMNLLSEETDGKDFSERSLYIYLEAVKKYQRRRKKAAGFDFLYFNFHSVTSINNEGTIREALERWDKTMAKITIGFQRMLPEIGANLLKDIIPKFNMDLTPQFNKHLLPQFQTPQISELLRSIIPNPSNLLVSSQKEDST